MSEARDTLILCTKAQARGGYALWWGPAQSGYYAELEGAGRYTKTKAEEICRIAEAVPVPEAEAVAKAYTVVDFTAAVGRVPGERDECNR